MQVARPLPVMLLAPVSAARSHADLARSVDVVLGRISVAWTATSTLALPHGADLRVLLALTDAATDDGQIQTGVPALLGAAHLGAGGRQQAALFAALSRLSAVSYTVQRAPQALGLSTEFRLLSWAEQAAGGQLHAELSPELTAQLCAARVRPTPRSVPDVPSGALALHGVLETLRYRPGMFENGQWRLPVTATCELLGLPGRGDNARRSLLTMVAALQKAGYVSSYQCGPADLILHDAGPDAELVALLTREGLGRTSATTLARSLGELVRPCLARARQVRDDSAARGKPVRSWTRLLADVLHHPDKYDVRALPPVVPQAAARVAAATLPELPDGAPTPDAEAMIRLLRLLAPKKFTESELGAIHRRIQGGLEDASALSSRVTRAKLEKRMDELVSDLRSRMQAEGALA